MRMKFSDIYRATLPIQSGNEGWIGIEPNGYDYHVVVPVDAQIARGVMACNCPNDGTPFGGYSRWLYFRCGTYECEEGDQEEQCRLAAAVKSSEELIDFARNHDIKLVIERVESSFEKHRISGSPAIVPRDDKALKDDVGKVSCKVDRGSRLIRCGGCHATWATIATLLRDSTVRICGYRADIRDFQLGAYVFVHDCGSSVEVPVRWVGRSRFFGKSLAGTHACPGLCYYVQCLSDCDAECEGSLYRRLAERLLARCNTRTATARTDIPEAALSVRKRFT